VLQLRFLGICEALPPLVKRGKFKAQRANSVAEQGLTASFVPREIVSIRMRLRHLVVCMLDVLVY
jgi:hypothetical protein